MMDVAQKEILKWLDAGVIYPIADFEWVSVRTKNELFLRYFYTCFMLVLIVFLRFLTDFILFCRFLINVKKGQKMVENGEKCQVLKMG